MLVNFEMISGVIDFLQKMNEQIQLYYYDTSGWLVFVRFLEENRRPQKTIIEINWPLKPWQNKKGQTFVEMLGF